MDLFTDGVICPQSLVPLDRSFAQLLLCPGLWSLGFGKEAVTLMMESVCGWCQGSDVEAG